MPTMETEQEKLERIERARKARDSRLGPKVIRRPLSNAKEAAKGEVTQTRLFKKGNMLRITGEEANGWEISPSTV